MRFAFFSDIHGNIEALNQGLADMRAREVDACFCLGDIGGDDCVRLVRDNVAVTVFGNAEVSAWRYLAPAAQRWVLDLPPQHRVAEQEFWISHASPAWPEAIQSLQDFLQRRHTLGMHSAFPYYLEVTESLFDAFGVLLAANIPLLFHGHTHRQLAWGFDPENQVHKLGPASFQLQSGWTYVVGVGSLGPPRDWPRPGYVIFDHDTRQVNFIRV